MTARIYDKTREVEGNGHDWWFDLWGERYAPGQPVMRVEFEFERQALREMGLSSPEEVLAATAELWAYATQHWLSYRQASDHSREARWPISAEWLAIQGCTLAGSALPRQRIEAGAIRGGLRRLMPLLNGCVAAFAALIGVTTIADACHRLPRFLEGYEIRSGRDFTDRVAEKVAARRR